MLSARTTTEIPPMPYSLVEPEHFTHEHRSFIERFARTIEVASSSSGVIAGAKDIRSRHFTASDSYGRIVGLPCGKDVIGRMDRDMPCEGTAAFADCYVREDQRLIERGDVAALTSVLNIHRYDTGLSALIFDKFLLKHRPSKSVLGVVYCAYETNLARFTALFPEYWSQFGCGCSIERVDSEVIDGIGRLSGLEHEVAFLLALGCDADAITCSMRRLVPDTESSVRKALRSIVDRMATAGIPVANMRDRLVDARVHQHMPTTFFDKVVGPRT